MLKRTKFTNAFMFPSGATFTLRNNSSVYTTGKFPESTVQGASGSRIRIQHTNGFYSGFSSAAINSSGNMGFILSNRHSRIFR